MGDPSAVAKFLARAPEGGFPGVLGKAVGAAQQKLETGRKRAPTTQAGSGISAPGNPAPPIQSQTAARPTNRKLRGAGSLLSSTFDVGGKTLLGQ